MRRVVPGDDKDDDDDNEQMSLQNMVISVDLIFWCLYSGEESEKITFDPAPPKQAKSQELHVCLRVDRLWQTMDGFVPGCLSILVGVCCVAHRLILNFCR